MNFSINKDVLLNALNDCSKALSSKIQMPGLTGIKFNVLKSGITITTSNNEISIQAFINKDIVVIEEGEFVAQGRILIDVIKKIPNRDIDFISFSENTIKVLSGKSDFTINCLQLESFPEILFEKYPTTFKINALNLKQIIKKTAFAASNSESRFILMGVSFIIKNNSLEVTATDSYRLGRKTIYFDYDLPDINIIVPSRSFEELNKILEESEEDVEITTSSTQIIFKLKNILFQSRLINGVFPKLDSLLPENYKNQIKFNKEELIQTVERVAIFVNNDISSIIKLTKKANGSVEFATTSNEIGAAKEEIVPIHIQNESDFQISFSSKYFLDALKAFDDEFVSINLTGEIKPFTITSLKDVNLVHLILPVRS